MASEVTIFRELILWLFRSNKLPSDYEDDRLRRIAGCFDLYSNCFSNEMDLASFLPSEDKVKNCFKETRYMCLPPTDRVRLMVPRIHLNCDFGMNLPEVRIRLELLLISDDGMPNSLGYRFESPEGLNDLGKGLHHYYHVQLIQSPPNQVDWLPIKQPAFPLFASNP